MGCGKSVASQMIQRRGFELIDSDGLVKGTVLPHPEVIAFAKSRWGAGVVAADGQLDRQVIAQKIFADDQERVAWESVIHQRLFTLWRELLGSNPQGKWVVEVPLLFEQRLENWFDFIFCVASSHSVQLARLSERGVSHALAGQRISKQLPLARKLELADLVLWNDGSLSFLEHQVDQALNELQST
jgi:dephospho-CoA kinase